MPSTSALDPTLLQTGQTRVFILEGGAGPGASAVYQGRARALGVDWPGGDVTAIRAPSATRYNQFDVVAKVRAAQGLPTMSLEFRMKRDIDDMLTIFQKGCAIDIHIHAGECQSPDDFQSFDMVGVLEGALMTSYNTGEQGAFEETAVVLQTLPFVADDYYMVTAIRDSEIGEAEIVQEVVGLSFADAVSCGQCGIPSDGAQVLFAVTKSHGGSPGLPAEVIYTANAGQTLGQTVITTLGANEDPTDLAAVGTNVVVISGEDVALHWAPVADILTGSETWARVATGFVALKLPNRIFNWNKSFTWIAADDGYVYFASDVTAGVTPQTAGSVTTEDLQDIHGVSDQDLIAVGDNNAMLVTSNGGNTWAAVVGPAVGINLTACWMRSKSEWMVGDANGSLWYTRDAGDNWTERTFVGSGSGAIAAIAFATNNVGYMSHTLSGNGRLLRSLDGGASWSRIPDGGNIGTLTLNDRLNRLAVPTSAPSNIRANVVWAGGLADDAIDGILLKVA